MGTRTRRRVYQCPQCEAGLVVAILAAGDREVTLLLDEAGNISGRYVYDDPLHEIVSDDPTGFRSGRHYTRHRCLSWRDGNDFA